MQPLTAVPRDGLTAADVNYLLYQAPNVTYQRGLDVLDLNLGFVADISDAFLAGTVTHNNAATIHGTCDLTVAADIDYARQFLRPRMRLAADGIVADFHCGVYRVNTPTTSYGESVRSNAMTGKDRLCQLLAPAGDAVIISGDNTWAQEIIAQFDAIGVPADHVLIDASALSAASHVYSWPLLADPNDTSFLPVDAIADDTGATTRLRIINTMAFATACRGVWMDWDGRFRIDPFIADASRPPELLLDFDDPRTSIVALNRQRTLDLSQVPNVWKFIQSNLVDGSGNPIAPAEGAGMYTVRNDNDGPTSVNARGGDPVGVLESVVQMDVDGQGSLVAQGNRQVAADQSTAATFALSTAPLPLAWHEDVYTYSDTEMGGAVRLMGSSWVLDFGNSTQPAADMQHTLRQVS